MKKHCVAKNLQGIWERFLCENNLNYNSYKCSYKFTFISFLSFRRNQKQGSNFQQVGGLVTRNSSAFCLWRVALYFKYIPNSVNIYKRIFLHVIPVIGLWFNLSLLFAHLLKRTWKNKRVNSKIFKNFLWNSISATLARPNFKTNPYCSKFP